jgi:hypothetical protein
MGMRMPETCWAVFKWQVINLRICCIWLVDSVESMMMHGFANPKFKNKVGRFILNYVVSCPWTQSFSQTSFGVPQIPLVNFKFKNVYIWHLVLYQWQELSISVSSKRTHICFTPLPINVKHSFHQIISIDLHKDKFQWPTNRNTITLHVLLWL